MAPGVPTAGIHTAQGGAQRLSYEVDWIAWGCRRQRVRNKPRKPRRMRSPMVGRDL